jgi:hypothetical protein
MNTPEDLGTALRSRVAGEHPDLDALVDVSTRRGKRIKSFRYAGAGVAAAAVVAAASVGVVSLSGGTGTTAVQPAASNTPSAPASSPAPPTNVDGLHVGEKVKFGTELGSGVVIQRPGQPITLLVREAGSLAGGKPGDPTKSAFEYIVQTFQHTPFEFVAPAHQKGSAPLQETAAGWTCQLSVADEHGTCTKPGAIASVSWRPADEHSSYLDPAHADLGPGYAHTGVTDVHGAWFATVQPFTSAKTTTQKDIDDLVAGITWK